MSIEWQNKKIQIGAVIDFCSAKDLKISKNQICHFFGVSPQVGSLWFPKSYSPNGPQELKKKFAKTSVSPTPRQQSPPMKRQNPVRNGGRDRKKLKSMIDDLVTEDSEDESSPPQSTPALSHASSSPTPEDPLTPAKLRIAQPGKKLVSDPGRQVKQEEEVEIKSEDTDLEFEV